jgi:hypothetical protein
MKTTLPIPYPNTPDTRESLLSAMKADSIKILPFLDNGRFGEFIQNWIGNAQHHGVFVGDQILKPLELGKPSFTRGDRFKADDGVVEVACATPLLIHFHRIGKKNTLQALLFVQSAGEWQVTPPMEISATGNNVRCIGQQGRDFTAKHIRMVQYYSEMTAHTLLVLGHHLRTLA